jgi:hypothetical protein
MLTQAAREERDRERDAKIEAGKAAGKSVRRIAEETGLPKSTVHRLSVPKEQTAEMGHPTMPDDEIDWHERQRSAEPSKPSPAWQQDLLEMESPAAQRWHNALAALREVNALDPVGLLFAERYSKVDHAIAAELEKAARWIAAPATTSLRLRRYFWNGGIMNDMATRRGPSPPRDANYRRTPWSHRCYISLLSSHPRLHCCLPASPSRPFSMPRSMPWHGLGFFSSSFPE